MSSSASAGYSSVATTEHEHNHAHEHNHSHAHDTTCNHNHAHQQINPAHPANNMQQLQQQQQHDAKPPTPPDLLAVAVKTANAKMVDAVLDKHPDAINGADQSDGATPVHWAALMGNMHILEHLLEKGGKPDAAVESTGMQPIHWAATRGHVEIVKRLIAAGVSIDVVDVKQTTPLAIAAQYDHTVLVYYLVKQRADIALTDVCDDSALHWAAYKGNLSSAALLHFLGLPADAADSYGSTPLHLAAAQGGANVVEYLLESTDAQALMALKDKKGRTAHAVAQERGQAHVLRAMAPMVPTLAQRLLACCIGQGGDAAMFTFFWVNSTACYVTYYYCAQHVGHPAQHIAMVVCSVLMCAFILKAFLTKPGFVPTEGKGNELYKKALELAADGDVESAAAIGSLCHTCHIARPLRSKHDSVLKRCVSNFDHHCPYVHNTIGARNYPAFLTFMFFGGAAIALAAAINLQYLLYVRFHPWVLFELIDHCLFVVFAVVMNSYHWSLVARNLTTNEHLNVTRYHYLRDDLGRTRNAFDKGLCANIADFWSRGSRLEANPWEYSDRYEAFQKAQAEAHSIDKGTTRTLAPVPEDSEGGSPAKAGLLDGRGSAASVESV